MSDNRNMVLAVVLSALILLGWSVFAERWFPSNPPATKIVNGKTVPLPQPGADPADDTPAAMRERGVVLGETPRVAIDTPSLKGSLNLKGAVVDDLLLVRHREGLATNSPPIRLFSPAGAKDAYFAGFGWTGQGTTLPGPDTVWTASSQRLTPGSPVTLTWDNGQGQTFAIALSVDENYMFTARQSVANRGAGAVAVRPYALIRRATKSVDPSSWTSHVGPMGVFDGAADYDVDFGDIAEGDRNFRSTGGWIGFTDKYWLSAIIPAQNSAVEATMRKAPGGGVQLDYSTNQEVITPGTQLAVDSRLFAGAKELHVLENYQDQLGIAKFDKAVDWGWFEWFMKPIATLLLWLYGKVGNFGVAIICLTLIIRLLMFPIAQKQFASMAAMRVLAPKQAAIQAKYGDDKVKAQQEILKLYQTEKVNPLAGCLPILLQIPIFYALYKVLLLSVEMRHKPFALWIQDLSAPDPLTPVNLFGFLPFTPPPMLAIGVLPILLGITMWVMQKASPPPTDPIQKQVLGLMPWLLTFVFITFAAGLQLYYVVSNLLSIAQQRWLYSRYPGLKTAPETIAPTPEPTPPPTPAPKADADAVPATMTRSKKRKRR